MLSPRHRLLAIAPLLLAPAIAAADAKTEAQDHLRKASVAHAGGNYELALDEMTLAYSLDPQPELLFSIGQLYMKQGDCESAIRFYKRFLATQPDEPSTKKTEKAIERCTTFKPKEEEQAAPETHEKPVDKPQAQLDPVPPPPIIEHTLPPPPAPVAHWYGDWIGHALVVGGVGAGVAGGLLYRRAVADRAGADSAATYQQTQDLLDSAQRQRTYSIIAASAGGVLVVTGVIHYAVHGGSVPETRVSIAPLAGGGLVAWRTQF